MVGVCGWGGRLGCAVLVCGWGGWFGVGTRGWVVGVGGWGSKVQPPTPTAHLLTANDVP